MKNDGDKLVAFMTAILIISVTYINAVPVPELVFNGTKFRFFTASPSNDWDSAQTNCESGGGNLATIKSLKEDTIVGLLTNPNSYFSCWIGLNDEANEAGTDASAFVWKDGSNSAYRNFEMFPSDTSGSDCVAYRYMMNNGVISNGWQNLVCDQLTNCSYCAKQESSMGCDLIYDGSCYRAFEVSGGINWLDAQSSCAVWGGDLTSVGVLRDQVLLNQYIPDSVGECWIGLHDRDGDWTFQWVDGTAVSYTRWDTNEPGVSTTDRCVELSSASDRNWKSISCDVRKNSFICEIDLNSLTTTDYRFGELVDGGLNFNLLTGNNFIFKSTILVCKRDVNSAAIIWQYSIRADLSSSEVLTATYMSTQTGVSWLSVDNTKQGYHQCHIDSTNTYTVGVYDTQKTTVAETGSTYTYTVGIDRTDVLLLCDPEDSSVTLSTITWTVLGGNSFTNPLNIYNHRNTLPVQSTEVNCHIGAITVTTISISLKAPIITIMFGSMIYGTFFSVNPSVNDFGIPISTSDMTISINLEGKWSLPDNSNLINSQVTISTFSSQNAGLYKFYITNWDGAEQCAMQLRLNVAIPETPEKEVTSGGSTYGYFTTTGRIHWLISQLDCLVWGGNLVTIDSKQVDSLLYYLTSDYTCWIGLNDRDNEAGNNGNAFVWVDGSTSTYRQWDTVYSNEPDGNTNTEFDCVTFRYLDGAANGWDDRTCDAFVSCYFCQKSGDSRGCDLIYDGSCYRAFEVSDGINWLDAQSSCAVWGGDLTSIATERENNLLYTAISDTVSNCWIGLYERDGDGVYQWVDGTALSYTNWTGSVPTAGSTTDCVQMNTIGAGNWIAADCEGTSNSFICKKPSTNTDTIDGRFGELINGGKDFQELSGNTFFFNSSLTLVCGGEENSAAITWQYSVNADLSSSEVLTANYMSTQTGISWLSVDNNKQGFYQCYIDSTNSYTVGVYDTQKTTVASEGILYQYIVGIDREDVLLLCDPMDSIYDFNSLSWHVNGNTFSNPLNIFSSRNSLPVFCTEINCLSNSATILTSNIRIYVPEITVTYSSSNTMRFSTLYPAMNTIQLEVNTEDCFISGNTIGRWRLQNGTYVSSSTVSYPVLKYEYFGLYQFYAINWDGDEVCVIQITIIPEEYSMTNSISLSNSETIQNGSTIVITDDYSMINCIISNRDYSVEWFYSSQLGAVQTDVTSSSTFSAGTGISTLNVYSNEPGYYSCVINTDIVYSFFVADRDLLIEIMNFASPSQQVDFTVGSTNSLLYYSDANIPDSSLRWTTETVTNRADTQYNIEYANPVLLSTVFSDVGAGVQTFSCFYRMSPVTLVGSLQLVIRDTAAISISYAGYDNTFSDVNNIMFPSPQQVTIPEGTRDVMLTCNLTQCMWMVQLKNRNYTVEMSPYNIPIFDEEKEGNYSLIRVTNTGKQYTTAHVYIHVQLNPTNQPSSSPLVPIVIVTLIIIAIVVALTAIIPIICIIVVRKMKRPSTDTNRSLHKPTKTSQSNEMSREGTSGYANAAEIQSLTKEYIDLSVNPNLAEYMTIDDTSVIPLETEPSVHNTKGPYNLNFANIPSDENNSEKVEGNREYIEMNQIEPHEKYTPMSAIKETKKFVAKYVPIKDFPVIYQQYVKSGMGDDSHISVEFQTLNEESKKYVELSDEARKEQNMRKNPIENILPYDESRVVLDSQYFDCNYINASWLESNQFIASIHPTGNTLQDFLQMIYQTEASMVIMLTTRKEKAKIIGGVSNRVCYWPEKDETLNCEPFVTSLISSSESTAFVKQEISLKNTLQAKDHSFTHCISPIWNEDGTVIEFNFAVTLLIRVLKQKRDFPLNPIIIHCEDGISKTGIFLTVFNVIKELNLRKSINIFNAVKNLRKQRMNMVPTKACYATCYSMMNEYCSIHL